MYFSSLMMPDYSMSPMRHKEPTGLESQSRGLTSWQPVTGQTSQVTCCQAASHLAGGADYSACQPRVAVVCTYPPAVQHPNIIISQTSTQFSSVQFSSLYFVHKTYSNKTMQKWIGAKAELKLKRLSNK